VADKGVFRELKRLSGVEGLVLGAIIALFISILLAASSGLLYRVLEGYLLPVWLRNRGVARHRTHRTNLLRDVAQAAADDPIALPMIREAIDRYPRAPSAVMPTKLGNVIRAGETYGATQYGLDTILLWFHLQSVAGAAVTDSVNQSRALMDFYCGLFWLPPLFAAAAGFSAWYGSSPIQLVGLAAILICPLAYMGVVNSAVQYGSSVRALVDIGRVDLAAKFGVSLPRDSDSERELWMAITNLVAWGRTWTLSSEWISTVDAARIAFEREGGRLGPPRAKPRKAPDVPQAPNSS
jgi:hypothetical protein